MRTVTRFTSISVSVNETSVCCVAKDKLERPTKSGLTCEEAEAAALDIRQTRVASE